VQVLKAALAATLAWAVAGWWLKAPLAFIAPWVAVVLVQSTVYRSIAQGVQQVLAIAMGTVVATVVGVFGPPPVVGIAITLPVALLLGSWRRLGSQGVYSATAALFTLTFGEVTFSAAVARVLETVLGAAIGIAVNALILPPVYLRSTHSAVRAVVREAGEILEAMAGGLTAQDGDDEEGWALSEAADWHKRALQLGGSVEDARRAIRRSRESVRANPGRRVRSGADAAWQWQDRYDRASSFLGHLATHICELTRTLADVRENAKPAAAVAGPYAEFLRQSAAAISAYGRQVVDAVGPDADEEVRRALDEVHRTYDELRSRLPAQRTEGPESLAVLGSLLTHARRLTDQLLPSDERSRGQ
jgi:hypothetical protein